MMLDTKKNVLALISILSVVVALLGC